MCCPAPLPGSQSREARVDENIFRISILQCEPTVHRGERVRRVPGRTSKLATSAPKGAVQRPLIPGLKSGVYPDHICLPGIKSGSTQAHHRAEVRGLPKRIRSLRNGCVGFLFLACTYRKPIFIASPGPPRRYAVPTRSGRVANCVSPVVRDTVRGGDPAAGVRKTCWSQGKHGPTGRYERSLCGSRKHGDAGNALLLRAFFVLALSSLFFLA